MKKFMWISLVFFIILGCGSRKKNLRQQSEKTDVQTVSSGQSNISVNNRSSEEVYLSEFSQDKNFKITSNGSPYQFQYGSLIFYGSADVEFTERKEEQNIKKLYNTFTSYVSQKKYQTITTYKTVKHFKTIDLERSGVSFGNIIASMVISIISGIVLWELIKRFLPIYFKKLIN